MQISLLTLILSVLYAGFILPTGSGLPIHKPTHDAADPVVVPAGFSFTTSATGAVPMVKAPVLWSKGSSYADVSLIFDSQDKLQEILGFGGAFTEASAYNYGKLTKANRAKLMELYFGATGNRYNMGRIPMNSCDFSRKVLPCLLVCPAPPHAPHWPSFSCPMLQSYSFDDGFPLVGTEDPMLKGFDDKASVDVNNGMIPMIQDALAAIKVRRVPLVLPRCGAATRSATRPLTAAPPCDSSGSWRG